MQDAKEEVRSRLNLEDVIGEYVPLKRAGRNWKGLSPFTNERTPSFIVSPDKQIWHDFSSNKGGDVFSFVMELEGLDFRGALELLARKAGVDLSLYQAQNDGGVAKKKQRLLSLLDLAAMYYQHSLLKNPRALEYVFGRRKLSKQIVQDFRIGYAPQAPSALHDFLRRKNFTDAEIKDAGLASSRGRGLDMFRARMMVPLADGQGQVIGFTARLIDDLPNAPKYVNTPQTLLYDKGRHVFGLHLAKEAIRTRDYAVIVEGNLDVISSHQVGITPVVATAGTALTEFHLKALSRLTPNIRLAFDADSAGIAATERAIPIAQTVGVRLSIISLPEGLKDPDDTIQKDPQLWTTAIESPRDVVDWLIAHYAERYDPRSAEGKRQITTRALAVIRRLNDPVEQEHYITQLSQVTGASVAAIWRKFDTGPLVPTRQLRKHPPLATVAPDRFAYQDSLLALMALYPETRQELKTAAPDSFASAHRQQIASYLATADDQPLNDIPPKPLQDLDTYVKILLLRAEDRYGDWNTQDRYMEAAKLARQVTNEQTKQQKDDLIKRLRTAEADDDDQQAADLRAALNHLIKEHQSGKKRRSPN